MINVNVVIPKSVSAVELAKFSFDLERDWKYIKDGDWGWVIQTYCHLKKIKSLSVILSNNANADCINIMSSSDYEVYDKKTDVYCITTIQDRTVFYPSQLVITQNKKQKPYCRYKLIPLWSQSGLIPQKPSRTNDKIRVAFFGIPENLANIKFIISKEENIDFVLRDSSNWNDYSDIDISIGVRDFDNGEHNHKPPTKMFNAWKAGVPFIGGNDSAFTQFGEPGINYLLALNSDEMMEHITNLISNKNLVEYLVGNGHRQFENFNDTSLLKDWVATINSEYENFCNWKKASRLSRRCKVTFLGTYYVIMKMKRRLRYTCKL